MNLKKLVDMGTKMLLFIVFMAWLFPNQWIFSVELKMYNPEKAAACERLVQKMAQPEEVRFMVSYGLSTLVSDAYVSLSKKIVLFSPFMVNDEYFLEIAAHELGHLEYRTSNQVLADLFAMRLVSREGIINYRKRNNSPPDYFDAITKCYESDGTNCLDVSDFSIFSIIYTLRQFFDNFLN